MKKCGMMIVLTLALVCMLCSCVAPATSDDPATVPTTTTGTDAATVTRVPSSDYTGVALNMPQSVSEIYESYDHTATLTVMPHSANIVKIVSSELGEPTYAELSEERVAELNALYASITEFKDYSGGIGAEPTIVIERDGETYRLGWGCATQRALNLYIDKIFACDASDEEWRAIDDMTYYSEENT